MAMMNENLARNQQRSTAGRLAPDPAWSLLGHAFTGYDWHGGVCAHAVERRRPERRSSGRFGPVTALRRLAARWRTRRELRYLGADVRADAGLAAVPADTARPMAADAFWQQVASWAHGRVPGDPTPGRPC